MKHRLTIATLFAASASAWGQETPAIARYVPGAPDPRHVFVLDSAHILSEAEVRALQDSAHALQRETGADVAWVTLPTLGGRAIEEATVYLGRTWKVGSAGNPGDALRNRGLVILYVPDKSKTAGSNFRVEVGTGLQGTIIDSRSRAISAAMRDDLRAKRYDDGYEHGWAVAAAMVREDFASRNGAATAATPEPSPPPRRVLPASASTTDSFGQTATGIVALIMIGGFLIVIIRRRSGRSGISVPSMMVASMADNDDTLRRRWVSSDDSSSSWSSGGSSDSGSSGDSGGDFGGGGGFDGGGSSDSI